MDFTKPKTFVLSIVIILIISLLVSLSLFLLYTTGSDSVGTYGVNKTVGWAWDITNYAPYIGAFVMVLCLLGYSVMWVLKFKVSKSISLINLVSLIAALLLGSTSMIIMSRFPELVLSFTAFVMLIINLAIGKRLKTDINEKKL
ncbi:hypothetical protein ABS768_01420 [Flavobacterium sp. ST-75]|uniref:DUF4293 family protein n=1 Tax=Flavobacterium rhizophilum TaxID=3163296 RepID=A0ABW8Y7F2_9FLAO